MGVCCLRSWCVINPFEPRLVDPLKLLGLAGDSLRRPRGRRLSAATKRKEMGRHNFRRGSIRRGNRSQVRLHLLYSYGNISAARM